MNNCDAAAYVYGKAETCGDLAYTGFDVATIAVIGFMLLCAGILLWSAFRTNP